MSTSFQTLANTKIDDCLLALAKVGLISTLFLGMNELASHNITETGQQTQFRRKDEDQTEAEQRRALRQQMREADRRKEQRARYRAAKKAKYQTAYKRLWAAAQTDSIILISSNY
jgi:hypothetical protein